MIDNPQTLTDQVLNLAEKASEVARAQQTRINSIEQSIPTVSDTYNSTSSNAMSGKAVASAVSGYVPTARTVNSKALSGNITLTASDVGALSSDTVIPTITDTYSATSSDGMSGKAVASAISGKADSSALSNYLPKSGGTMTGVVKWNQFGAISRNNNTGGITLGGGDGTTYGEKTGALLTLYGSEHSDSNLAGRFQLVAINTDETGYFKDLIGKPDGSLKWAGNEVLTTANGLPLTGGTVTGSVTLSNDRNVPLTINLNDNAYKDIEVVKPDGNRLGVIRFNQNETYNIVQIGPSDAKNSAPIGLTIQRTIGDGTTAGVVSTTSEGLFRFNKNTGYKVVSKGTVSTATVTFNVQDASVQSATFASASASAVTIALSGAESGWSYNTTLALTNAGSVALTFPTTINWVAGDGTTTTAFATYMSTIGRTALASSGLTQIAIWTIGTTYYGKII